MYNFPHWYIFYSFINSLIAKKNKQQKLYNIYHKIKQYPFKPIKNKINSIWYITKILLLY
jgi:hypothetical protein